MADRGRWVVLLLVAMTVRLAVAALETAFVHPDAMFQALEPAHRLVHGHGHVAWEFREGVRNWVWPGVMAAVLQAVHWLGLTGEGWGTGPGLASVAVVVAFVDGLALVVWAGVAARFVEPRFRSGTTIAVVLVGSALPIAVVPGSQPIIGVPTGLAMAWAAHEGLRDDDIHPVRLGVAAGALMFLRIQMAPVSLALLGVALWSRRRHLAHVGAGFTAVAVAFGLLDWVTWGGPWSSLTGYLHFSFTRSDAVFGQMESTRYASMFFRGAGFLGVGLVGLSLSAVRRAWPLWVVMLCILVPHHIVGQKQLHFLHPAMALLVVLAVVGFVTQAEQVSTPARRVGAGLLGLWVLVAGSLGFADDDYWRTTWLHNHGGDEAVARSRGLNAAYVELSTGPAPGRIVQAVLPQQAAPGHALLGHDVPEIHVVSGQLAGAPQPGDVVVTYDGPPVPGATRVWADDRGTVVYRVE